MEGKEEGEEKRKISQFFAAGMLAPASPPEYRHGRLWAVGAGGSPAPERSTAARRAAWWQERGRKGERKQKRSAGQKNCVSAIMGGWQAGLVLGERQGGAEHEGWGKARFPPPAPPTDGSPSACL